MNEQSSPALAGSGVVAPLAMDREFRCHHCHAVRITDGVPASRPQDVAGGGKISVRQLELFPEQFVAEYPDVTEAEWSRRYFQFTERYMRLDFATPEAVEAVIEGLQAWADMLPQRSRSPGGPPHAANAWGLGAEETVLRAFISHLAVNNKSVASERIRLEFDDLLRTASSLDECCMRETPDPRAEARLVATARMQVKALIKLLTTVRRKRRFQADEDRPRRKRSAPSSPASLEDHRLVKEWESVKGKAGMCRKEFCARKGVSVDELIRAMDRVRKQNAKAKRQPRQPTPELPMAG